METIKETNNSQYVNGLHDIENNNIVKTEESIQLVSAPYITDECCAKILIAYIFTSLVCPFAICDVYYASTDTSCVNQDCNGLAINMHSYLLASGIIIFIGIGVTNLSIFCFDYKMVDSKKYSHDSENRYKYFFWKWLFKFFGISWLVTGCVLFWAYMDISKCNSSIKNYLFTRFIIFLVFTVTSIKQNSE